MLAAFLAAGCKGTPSVTGVRWEIERQIPGVRLEGRLDRVFAEALADDPDELFEVLGA